MSLFIMVFDSEKTDSEQLLVAEELHISQSMAIAPCASWFGVIRDKNTEPRWTVAQLSRRVSSVAWLGQHPGVASGSGPR